MKFKAVTPAQFDAHIAGKTLVRPRPDLWMPGYGATSLCWELSDGSVFGITVADTGCPTCGMSIESTYWIAGSST